MELRQAIQHAIQELPEDKLREILDFARFIAHQREDEEWQESGLNQFARAYGPDEPEYSEADVKRRP